MRTQYYHRNQRRFVIERARKGALITPLTTPNGSPAIWSAYEVVPTLKDPKRVLLRHTLSIQEAESVIDQASTTFYAKEHERV